MTWVWIILAAWALLAIVGALVIGRSIRMADRNRTDTSNFVIDEVLAVAPPEPRPPLSPGVTGAHEGSSTEPQRRSAPPSVVQNCVPATERSLVSQPPLPHPRS